MANEKATKPPTSASESPQGYTVVARRYRPQRFEEVVGQDHVVQSLRNALNLHRVTHAYLFCGTRGVGKTSIARIFAKCLNCVRGPTADPCLQCDICRAIAVGQDVDVIEIDGASNNGVDAVRELRQNAGLRPSRSRFKIYYIDEVHMLSTGAFNALLKTLEEPPEHVKFFFATTEANRIPVTVLSRCQRYDFAGISPEQIVATLGEICEREQVEAETDALQAVARRAGGSMRDAQSLLEQLLSASGGRLSAESVHRLLGTASDERLLDLLEALAGRDAAAALGQMNRAVDEGVQPTDLLNGLLEFLRDVMVLSVAPDGVLLTATPRQRPRIRAIADRWTLDTILAALQVLAEARGRLRGSPHGRLLVELAIVRVTRLENLAEVGDLIGRLAALEGGAGSTLPASGAGATGVKKKLAADPHVILENPTKPPSAVTPPISRQGDASPDSVEDPAPQGDVVALDLAEVRRVWPDLSQVGLRLWKGLSQLAPSAILEPNVLVIRVGPRYNWAAVECGTVEGREKIEETLSRLLHRQVRIRFESAAEDDPSEAPRGPSTSKRRDDLAEDPMIQKVVELFDARAVHLEVEDERSPTAGG